MAVEQIGGGNGGIGGDGDGDGDGGVRVVGGELDIKKSGGRRLTKVARDEPKRPKNVEKRKTP